MTAESVHAGVARLFRDRLNLEVESADLDLFDSGLLDSMSFVELLVQLEKEFGIAVSVDDVDIDKFRSIDAIAAFVHGSLMHGAVTGALIRGLA